MIPNTLIFCKLKSFTKCRCIVFKTLRQSHLEIMVRTVQLLVGCSERSDESWKNLPTKNRSGSKACTERGAGPRRFRDSNTDWKKKWVSSCQVKAMRAELQGAYKELKRLHCYFTVEATIVTTNKLYQITMIQHKKWILKHSILKLSHCYVCEAILSQSLSSDELDRLKQKVPLEQKVPVLPQATGLGRISRFLDLDSCAISEGRSLGTIDTRRGLRRLEPRVLDGKHQRPLFRPSSFWRCIILKHTIHTIIQVEVPVEFSQNVTYAGLPCRL